MLGWLLRLAGCGFGFPCFPGCQLACCSGCLEPFAAAIADPTVLCYPCCAAGKLPFEDAPQDDRSLADIHLALYNDVVVFDHATKLAFVISWVRRLASSGDGGGAAATGAAAASTAACVLRCCCRRRRCCTCCGCAACQFMLDSLQVQGIMPLLEEAYPAASFSAAVVILVSLLHD